MVGGWVTFRAVWYRTLLLICTSQLDQHYLNQSQCDMCNRLLSSRPGSCRDAWLLVGRRRRLWRLFGRLCLHLYQNRFADSEARVQPDEQQLSLIREESVQPRREVLESIAMACMACVGAMAYCKQHMAGCIYLLKAFNVIPLSLTTIAR